MGSRPDIEIREVARLLEADVAALHGWGDDIFQTAELGLTWRSKDLHFMLFEDGRLASHAALLKHVVIVNGRQVPVAGLGGVVTLPWAQRRGFAQRIVAHAMSVFKNWEVDGGLLFCRPPMVDYYRRLGWTQVHGPVTIEQPTGPRLSPLPVMTVPNEGRLGEIARIDLRSLPW